MRGLEQVCIALLGLISVVVCHENPRQFNNVVSPPEDGPPHSHNSRPAPAARGRQPVQPPKDNRLRDKKHTQNREHVREHLDGKVNMAQDQLSEEELQFHYFKLHDYDNNNKLDGIELTSAVTHFHAEDENAKNKVHVMSDSEIAPIVDSILMDEDINDDGYIDYAEFMVSQRGAPMS